MDNLCDNFSTLSSNVENPPKNPESLQLDEVVKHSSSNADASTNGSEVSFIAQSVSDVDISDLEERIHCTFMDDMYCGPVVVRGRKLVRIGEETSEYVVNSTLPNSTDAGGVIKVTKMLPAFANDKLSNCNRYIQSMDYHALRCCLYAHGLNQRGSRTVLTKRLQEFVRRFRAARGNDGSSERLQYALTEIVTNSAVANSSTSPDTEENSQLVSIIPPSINDLKREITLSPVSETATLYPDIFYSYLLIIDLEATCDLGAPNNTYNDYPHEIIEFPILLYDTRAHRCVAVFHAYCQPTKQPTLSEFCTELTGISQATVDGAQPFEDVLQNIEKWLFTRHELSNYCCAIVCDCDSDMGKFMRIQCGLSRINFPPWVTSWINLTKAFSNFYKVQGYRLSLHSMLEELNLSFYGKAHSGLDDAINIMRIVRTMLTDGCLLRVNERADFSRPPKFVSAVTRDSAANFPHSMRTEPPRHQSTRASQRPVHDVLAGVRPQSAEEEEDLMHMWSALKKEYRPSH